MVNRHGVLEVWRKNLRAPDMDIGLNPSTQFFIDALELLLIGRKGIQYAQLKFTCVLNLTERCFHTQITPRKPADIFKTFLKAL